jgi:hypothetical protein
MTTPTLFAALSAMPDHRTRKGRRFPLAALITISLAAMLSGANDLRAIFRWGRRLSPKALQALGVDPKRKKAPCHATYHYVFQSISSDDLRAALGALVKAEGGLGEPERMRERQGLDQFESFDHFAAVWRHRQRADGSLQPGGEGTASI